MEIIKGKNVKQTERDLKKGFPEKDWNKLLQIIFYGRGSIALLEVAMEEIAKYVP